MQINLRAAHAVYTISSNLRRATSSGKYIPEVDGLRFVAIMAVLLHHIVGAYVLKAGICTGSIVAWQQIRGMHWLIDLAAYGHYGVHFFFVISGFVLALPFAAYYLGQGEKVRLQSYFLRRLKRIEPPYIISTIIIFLILYGFSSKCIEMLPHLGANLIYGYSLLIGEFNLINEVIWSLEVEVQFYLLAPALCLLFRIKHATLRRAVLLSLIAICGCLSQYIIEDIPRIRLTIVNNLQFFLTGLFLADLYLQVSARGMMRKSIFGDAVGLVGAGLTLYVCRHGETLSLILLPFTAAMLFIAAFKGKHLSALLTIRPLTTIGGMCYTIYLYHFRLMSPIFSTGFTTAICAYPLQQGIWICTAVTLAVILFVSTVMFALCEKPFMNKFVPGRRKAPRTASPGAGNIIPGHYAA